MKINVKKKENKDLCIVETQKCYLCRGRFLLSSRQQTKKLFVLILLREKIWGF